MERGRISRMSGQPTRGGLPPETSGRAARGWVPAEWRAFAAFLRRPRLPDRAELSLAGSLRALVPLLALDLLLMALVLAGIGVAIALGFELPEHMLGELKLTPALVAFMLIGAPIGEEIIFRGWLSGRPGHILGSALFVIAAGLILAGSALGVAGGSPIGVFGAAVAALVLAVVALFALRKRDAIRWFQRHFGWFFYASTLAFAAIHLTNFGGAGSSAAMLPLVLPQLLLGLILGYVRVQRGLVTAITLHALHNTLFASLMLLGLE
jgi:membrane protease YdiL (CAAX protease family)